MKNKVNKRKEATEKLDEYGLTNKQRLFCYYYMQSFNARQSSLKAGYSESFALSQSYKLLEHDGIKKFLNDLKEEQKEKFFISQERLLTRHSQIAFADINDFINPDGTLKKNTDGTLIKKITIRNSNSSSMNGSSESSSVSIELEDRKESLKFLTEYMGLDPKIEIAKQKLEIEKEKNKEIADNESKLEEYMKALRSALENGAE